MTNKVEQFLGDTPTRTIIKLLVISFVVGIIMSALNFSPYDVWVAVRDFFIGLYNLGFEALGKIGGYLALGAAVVIPIFIIMRLLKIGK